MPTQTLYSKKRIAKNTLLLYIRMLVMMGVSLYTSRVVLQKLGVDDFGLYNIIGGIVVLFSVLNSSLAGSTQRFLNYELGKGNDKSVNSVFQNSLSLHVILCVILLVLSETIGLWYINSIMNIPADRIEAANIVYQFSVITFCVNVLRVPFNASIIAYEKMDFYAYISIVEAVLKLLIVYLLSICEFDRLIFYAFLVMLVTCIINASYMLYCSKAFTTIHTKLQWDNERIKVMLSFSGWSLFGSTAVISAQHGINLVLNYFCGVGLNAAAGIANQVTSAIYGFITNFQTAFNPQIIKLYAQKEREELFKLVFAASKISFLLFWMISVSVLYTAPFILDLWLGNVPPHTTSFCRVMIVFLLIDALNGPLWTAVNATGRIRNYQILMSSIILCNIPVAIIMLKMGCEPESVWFTKIFFNVVAMVGRIFYLIKLVHFPVLNYIKQVIIPIMSVSMIPSIVLLVVDIDNLMYANKIFLILGILCYTLITILTLGLNRKERIYIFKLVKKK